MDYSYLECMVASGLFNGEFAVRAQMIDGQPFSLFASEEDVVCRVLPKPGEHVPGLIKVEVLVERENQVLIMLPQPTLENGQTVTVASNSIKKRVASQFQRA